MKCLEERWCFFAVGFWVVQELFFGVLSIVEDGGGKCLFKENRQDLCAFAAMDLTGIGLVIVEDQELAGADGYPAVVDAIPFFAVEDRFYREAADVVGAMALGAEGIEDDILFFEPVEMGLFVETRDAMVG